MMKGQPAHQAYQATTRLFGYCGGSHQQAATMALEQIYGTEVPTDASLLRSIALASEIIQSAIRWTYTSFAPDLISRNDTLALPNRDLSSCFSVYAGSSFKKGILASGAPMALYALIAGQWPYADFAVPGGVNTKFSKDTHRKALELLEKMRVEWIEPLFLGASIESFLSLQTADDLFQWLDRLRSYSDLKHLIYGGLACNFDSLGAGLERYLSGGSFRKKNVYGNETPAFIDSSCASEGIFIDKGVAEPFIYNILEKQLVANPIQAIHYRGGGVEVGALARMMALNNNPGHPFPLFRELSNRWGSGVLLRAFAKWYEVIYLFDKIKGWLSALQFNGQWKNAVEKKDGVGVGFVEAPRGLLIHRIKVADGHIMDYKIIPPTIFNLHSGTSIERQSPVMAAIAEMIIKDIKAPEEIGVIARSFDACLTCRVHVFKSSSGKPICSVSV